MRSSQRITVTIPDVVLHSLIKRSGEEGRSVSNLVAFLVERSLTA